MLSERARDARNSTKHLSFAMDKPTATPTAALMLAASSNWNKPSRTAGPFNLSLYSGILNP